MTDSYSSDLIPEGFVPNNEGPYSNLIGPLLYKIEMGTDGHNKGTVGLLLKDHHVGGNNRGHGGLLLTLLDEAMGMNAYFRKDNIPTVTVSMSVNFIAATLPGEFLYATADVTQATKSLAFVEGKAFCGGKLVGTANGVWKYLNSAAKSQQQAQQQQ
ncbi:MAG TPA: PaaI family thioesterase [Dongiaceae bacterium]|nr:PaaI family thioesterase [Dongiaceae bacterium]